MATTETKIFYPKACEDYKVSDSAIGTPENPVGKGSDNTTYASIYAYLATSYAYWPFGASVIPEDAVIDSVECTAKAKISSTSYANASLQLFSGDTAKGSATNFASTKEKVYSLTTGTWTRAELDSIRLKTEVTSTKSNGRTLYFYGADLTVTYTYKNEKFMLKLGGSWTDVARVFKKVNGIWVEQTELSSVVEDGVRYQNGGEIISPKKTVTLTGTGDNNASTTAAECYVEINGVKYVSATTVEVDSGTTMLCYAHAASVSITLNGSSVGSGTPKQYTHTVNENCTVTLSVDVSYNSKATIAITTQ